MSHAIGSRAVVHAGPAPLTRPDDRGATASAWLLGHALGLHCDLANPPADYDSAQRGAFGDGYRIGELRRWIARERDGEPVAVELGEWLAACHGDDHDAQPDPFDVGANTIPDWEWREVSIGFTRDTQELIHDAERERVLVHRAYAGQKGGGI